MRHCDETVAFGYRDQRDKLIPVPTSSTKLWIILVTSGTEYFWNSNVIIFAVT